VMMTAPANQRMPLASQKMVLVNLATTIPDVEARTANHEKMRLPPKHQKMILNFDATLAVNATVVAAVVMTALANQKMMSPVSRRMLPANLATAMIANVRDAREVTNLEKMKRLKIPKIFLSFDATFVEENDVADAVVMTTAPVNQRMSLVSQKMVPVNLATTIPDVEARKTANHEKISLPPKHQKMILNFDATLAANATDLEAAVVMMTAPVNLVTMTTVNDAKVAREAGNHEKMTRKRRKHQKIFLSSDATFAKASDAMDDVGPPR